MINEITEQAIAGQELGGCFLVFIPPKPGP